MKMNTKKGVLALLGLAILFLLSSCSGIIGGDGLYVYVDELNNARYIDSGADSGYIVVVKGNEIYSLGTLENKTVTEFENGSVRINGIPTGDYVVVVVLIDDSDPNDGIVSGPVVGFKLAGVEVKKGPNYLPIVVGPGLSNLSVGSITDVEALFNPQKLREDFKDVTVRLEEDAIYLGGTGASSVATDAIAIIDDGTTNELIGSTLIAGGKGREFEMTDGDDVTHYLSVVVED